MRRRLLICHLATTLGLPFQATAHVSTVANAEVAVSSFRADYAGSQTIDRIVSDDSRWLAVAGDPAPWLKLQFAAPIELACLDIFSGWETSSGLSRFEFAVETASGWETPPAGRIDGLPANHHRIVCKRSGVRAIRLQFPAGEPGRIREIAAYDQPAPPIGHGLRGAMLPLPPIDLNRHQIAVNQVGYETGRPKRFTAPLSADGTRFILREATGGPPLFESTITGGIGDFSSFRPADANIHYRIEVHGSPLEDGFSDPFLIRSDLLREQFWQTAVDFLIDTRAVVGTHPSAFGGCPWRDGTYYDAILPALVLFYLADRNQIELMPRQIDWAADKARVLGADFRFDANNPCPEGVLDTVRKYYGLEPPRAGAPDVVQMIHWGTSYYLINPASRDPMGDPDPRRIHSQTVEQVAYVVWAWPALEKWLPRSFYEQCRDFCFQHWDSSLKIDPWWEPVTYLKEEELRGDNPMGGLLHPYKGRHAPGHSIVPNLLMHEIAVREGRDDADTYLEAAVAQAAWCVETLDWNDPRTTKGQRVSEHRTLPNLIWLLQKYPQQAPTGLRRKIEQWIDVALARSDNLWDFRRYDMDGHWTVPKLNDLGSTLGLPAIATAASWVADDPADRRRLREIAMAAVDHVFGRNPRLAASPSRPWKGFPEVERGWPREHQLDVCARLENSRGSLSASPGSEMFPFSPDGGFRHAEGWVNYGAAWCISLAYLQFDSTAATPAP